MEAQNARQPGSSGVAILVTGGAGFVGSHLVNALLRTTDLPVVVLDNFNDYYDPRLKRQNSAAWTGQSRVTLVEGTYCDSDTVDALLLDHSVSAICHLGASPG